MAATDPISPRVSTGPMDLNGCRILAVDDDRLNLRILGGILRGENYVLNDADSGEKAIELYPAFRPNLVLLDVMLPGMDGFATCRELKRIHGDACAPVIFVTARNDTEGVVEGLAAGGVDYLTKPFQPKEVVARVRTHLTSQLLTEQQKHLVAQLSKANADKNRFLGMAAHDLRNPLASIRGLAELMSDGTVGPLNAEQTEMLQMMSAASQSMLELVNELLDVATIEAGELKVELAPTSLAPVIEKSVYFNNIEAAKKKTRVEFDETSLGPALLLDPAKIRQVCDNLISNAVKYSPKGSTITVALHSDDTSAGFLVRDQGPGIPDDERDRLFKDFSRLSVRPTGGEKSTGLGLAICRKIIDAHHGTITARNLSEKGCEFKVALPLLSK